MHLRRLAAPFTLLLVGCAMTACGGGGSTKASVSAGATVAPPSVPSTLGQVHATGGGAFCTQVANSLNSQRNVAASATPADLRKHFEDAKSKEQQALRSAPDEIRPDLTILVNVTIKLGDALAQANWDFTKLTPSATAGFSAPEVTTATQHLTTWIKAHCGIDVGAPTP